MSRQDDIDGLIGTFEAADRAAVTAAAAIEEAVSHCTQARDANLALIAEARRSVKRLRPLEDGVVSRVTALARSHLNTLTPGALKGDPATGGALALDANIQRAQADVSDYNAGLSALAHANEWIANLRRQLAENIATAESLRSAPFDSAVERGSEIWAWSQGRGTHSGPVPQAMQRVGTIGRSASGAAPGSLPATFGALTLALRECSHQAEGLVLFLNAAKNW